MAYYGVRKVIENGQKRGIAQEELKELQINLNELEEATWKIWKLPKEGNNPDYVASD